MADSDGGYLLRFAVVPDLYARNQSFGPGGYMYNDGVRRIFRHRRSRPLDHRGVQEADTGGQNAVKKMNYEFIITSLRMADLDADLE